MPAATAVPETSSKPVKVFRDRRLSVSVFRNRATVEDRERTFHSVSLQRSYKDGEAFKNTHSLGKDDLPAAQLLLAQAWQWIVGEEAAQRLKAA
jgi:hypothetical protein